MQSVKNLHKILNCVITLLTIQIHAKHIWFIAIRAFRARTLPSHTRTYTEKHSLTHTHRHEIVEFINNAINNDRQLVTRFSIGERDMRQLSIQ